MTNVTLEDIVEEYLELCRDGNNPNIKEFANKYPSCSSELLEILPLLQDLEELGYKKSTLNIIPDLACTDYQIIEKIGVGGMGIVYKALQISLNRKVAIKLLSNELLKDKKQREQFENEAKIIAMLHHPNIVKILNAKCSANRCYYAMELIEGKSLSQYMINDVRKIAEIALKISRALAYAHSCKVLHRDIKPSNILIDNIGEVHVSDFGLASFNNNSNNIDNKSGTLRYMAPEKILRGDNSILTDEYSFGVTLYELATHQPFLSNTDLNEMSQNISRGIVPKLKTAKKDFDAIVNKCLNYLPSNRYKNMEEVAEDLQRFLNNEPVSAKKYTLIERYKLWNKRQPASAFFCLCAIVSVIAFVLALAIGFIQTQSALKLAKKNVNMADATLAKIFDYTENQAPSSSGSVLLGTLMPYYQEISVQKGLPKSRLIQANKIVGLYALRSGNYELAEKSYKQLTELGEGANSLKSLADAYDKQGNKSEAEKIRKEIIKKYSNSAKMEDKYAVVCALTSLSDDGANQQKAYELIKSLLEQDRQNPEYLYQYAMIIATNPRKFNGEKPIKILNSLANKYPDNPDYSIAIVELMTKELRYSNNFTQKDWNNITLALNTADKLMSRFPNTPKVVESVVKFKTTYIKVLRHNGDMPKSRKEIENLLGMLELLFYNPETPNSAKECLIELQLERLKLFVRDNRISAIKDLSTKLNRELNSYNGSKQKEYRRAISRLGL